MQQKYISQEYCIWLIAIWLWNVMFIQNNIIIIGNNMLHQIWNQFCKCLYHLIY